MSDAQRAGSMGWPRATVRGVLIVGVAAVVLVYVPDLFLRRLTGLDRGQRVLVASLWFFLALGALAWTLRRLQAHQEI